jgi:hypothetical protein
MSCESKELGKRPTAKIVREQEELLRTEARDTESGAEPVRQHFASTGELSDLARTVSSFHVTRQVGR